VGVQGILRVADSQDALRIRIAHVCLSDVLPVEQCCRSGGGAVIEWRRASFRVPVRDPGWLSAVLLVDEGVAIGVAVLDLSRLGMGARVRHGAGIASGQPLRCRLSFDKTRIETEATVRHCTATGAGLCLGLEFTALTPSLERALSGAVFRLERYLLRRMRSGINAGLMR